MEDLMQFIWRFRLWPVGVLTDEDGRSVEIIDPGTLNTGSGPDFFNAKIRLDGDMLAGNVELHVRATDWHRHGHDSDPAYGNVILHVVADSDARITSPGDGRILPQLVMRNLSRLCETVRAMTDEGAPGLPCGLRLAEIPSLHFTDLLSSLVVGRLQRKADDVAAIAASLRGDWADAAYIFLARGLGFGANADPMERLARAVPLRVLRKHADSAVAVESMLMGWGGLLHEPPRDDYEGLLLREFAFYRHKFEAEVTGPSVPLQWATRGRPQNAPIRRLALLAAIIRAFPGFGGELIAMRSPTQATRFFDVTLPEYWQTHLIPGSNAVCSGPAVSAETRTLLTVNVIAPVIYAYGEYTGDPQRIQTAVDILFTLPAENNSIVRTFIRAGFPCTTAYHSQAYLQLHRQYCQHRSCLTCRIGHRLLAATACEPLTPYQP